MSEESSKQEAIQIIEILEAETNHSPFRFRPWRMLNTIILLIAFFAPWVRGCEGSRVSTGYELTFVLGKEYELGLTIGGLSFIIYVFLNLVRGVTETKPNKKIWLIIPLAGSVSFLVIVGALIALSAWFIEAIGPTDRVYYFWGYWLAWIGVLSSIFLERLDLASEMDRRREETST